MTVPEDTEARVVPKGYRHDLQGRDRAPGENKYSPITNAQL